MRLIDIETPFLVLDRGRLAANASFMAGRAARLGVRLRPHVKTIKSVDALRYALPAVDAITVSTLREAEYFAGAGYRDILYAVGLAPGKIAHVAKLRAQHVDLHVVVDTVEAAQALASAEAPPSGFSAYIEIDTGGGRGGVLPDDAQLLNVAHALTRSNAIELRGVLTHAGQSYRCRTIDDVKMIAEAERAGAVFAAGRLRGQGFACPEVSVGSTPTAIHAASLDGATEMRPGVFFLMDVFQQQVGACGAGDLALSVVASVIGVRPNENIVLVDAGALALSQDRSTAGQDGADWGFGRVGGVDGGPWPGAKVSAVHQEHGFVHCPDAQLLARLRPGSRVRIWPNHACMTAAGHEHYTVVEGNDAVVATWPRVNHW
ncbi:MAG: alanine racemase [Alphaproteobacteria bacterium]